MRKMWQNDWSAWRRLSGQDQSLVCPPLHVHLLTNNQGTGLCFGNWHASHPDLLVPKPNMVHHFIPGKSHLVHYRLKPIVISVGGHVSGHMHTFGANHDRDGPLRRIMWRTRDHDG